jgi:hypothetical protein
LLSCVMSYFWNFCCIHAVLIYSFCRYQASFVLSSCCPLAWLPLCFLSLF